MAEARERDAIDWSGVAFTAIPSLFILCIAVVFFRLDLHSNRLLAKGLTDGGLIAMFFGCYFRDSHRTRWLLFGTGSTLQIASLVLKAVGR
jgi:hypothetical protein